MDRVRALCIFPLFRIHYVHKSIRCHFGRFNFRLGRSVSKESEKKGGEKSTKKAVSKWELMRKRKWENGELLTRPSFHSVLFSLKLVCEWWRGPSCPQSTPHYERIGTQRGILHIMENYRMRKWCDGAGQRQGNKYIIMQISKEGNKENKLGLNISTTWHKNKGEEGDS